jgi:hypothetical protein
MWNNATQADSTSLYVSQITDDGVDVALALANAQPGDIIVIADEADHNNFQRWELSAAPIPDTTYAEVPVTYVDGTHSFNNNDRITIYYLREPSLALSDLIDADIYGDPDQTAQALVWNPDTDKWERRRLDINYDLNGISVDQGSIQGGHVLTWAAFEEGGEWQAQAPAGGSTEAKVVLVDIKNVSGETIYPGAVVYATDYDDGAVKVSLLDLSTTPPDPEQIVGLVYPNSIDDGEYGTAVVYGTVANITDNSNWGPNTPLYPGADFPGQLRPLDTNIPADFQIPIAYSLDGSDPEEEQTPFIFVNMFKHSFAVGEAAPSDGIPDIINFSRPRPDSWIPSGLMGDNDPTSVVDNNAWAHSIIWHPILLGADATFEAVKLHLTELNNPDSLTGNGSIKFAIYTADPETGLPKNLVDELGEYSLTASTNIGIVQLNFDSVFVAAGMYYLGFSYQHPDYEQGVNDIAVKYEGYLRPYWPGNPASGSPSANGGFRGGNDFSQNSGAWPATLNEGQAFDGSDFMHLPITFLKTVE